MTEQLIGIRAENYKRLELVNIDFPAEGGVVAIMGENAAGKSSLLDALETTIAGRNMPKSARPVHVGNGADKARIVATFDDIVVTRVFKDNGATSISVVGTDGVRFTNTEEVLKRLYSHIALDPLAFSRLKDEEQVNALLPLIGYDPKPLDVERKDKFDLRTVKGREVKALEARVAAFPDPTPGLGKVEISVAALSEELSRVERANAAIETLAVEVERRAETARTAEALVESLRAQLEVAEENASHARDSHAQAVEAAAEAKIVDTADLREQIATAETTNAAIRTEASRQAVVEELKTVTAEHAALSAEITEIEGRKSTALAAAASKMPVPGLALSDDEDPILLLDGIPFSQASTGVQIKTGTAIAMALNPDLRVIVIRDASLLDLANREVIDRLAKDNGFLVLMEIADESSPVGVVIEAGNVREVRTAGAWEA